MTAAASADALTAPIAVPSISPGTYIRLRREALGLSIETVALMLETDPVVCARRRVEWLAMIEADAEEISLRTALVLHDAIGIDLRILAYWMAIAEGATPSLIEVMFASRPEMAA